MVCPFFIQDTTMTKNSKNAVSVLQDVIAIHLHFSTWTGRKILEENDLSLQGEAPPKEIINLGSKHTTDPAALKVFNTLKRRAERACLRKGIPFMGGYAIPVKDANEIALELDRIVRQYNEVEKANYLAKHESIQSQWVQNFPKYELILRKALTPVEHVEKRINAAFSMFQLQSAASSVSAVDVGLSKQVDSMSESLDSEILKGAKSLLASLTNAIQPSQKNVNTLKQLRERVEGLAFLNGKFANLVREMRVVEEAMPITGKLSTDDVNKLSGLLYRMSDEDKLNSLMSSLQQEPTPFSQTTKSVVETETVQAKTSVVFDFGEEAQQQSEPESVPNVDDLDFDFGDLPTLPSETKREPSNSNLTWSFN